MVPSIINWLCASLLSPESLCGEGKEKEYPPQFHGFLSTKEPGHRNADSGVRSKPMPSAQMAIVTTLADARKTLRSSLPSYSRRLSGLWEQPLSLSPKQALTPEAKSPATQKSYPTYTLHPSQFASTQQAIFRIGGRRCCRCSGLQPPKGMGDTEAGRRSSAA